MKYYNLAILYSIFVSRTSLVQQLDAWQICHCSASEFHVLMTRSKTWLSQEETPYLPWTTACGEIRSIWWSISFLKKHIYKYKIYTHILIGQPRKPLLQQVVRKQMLDGSAKATISTMLAAKESATMFLAAKTDWLAKLVKIVLANYMPGKENSGRERLAK